MSAELPPKILDEMRERFQKMTGELGLHNSGFESYRQHLEKQVAEEDELARLREQERAAVEACVDFVRGLSNFRWECGCSPCRGQCRPKEIAEETIHNYRDEAGDLIKMYDAARDAIRREGGE